ncbi:serine protein kinase RIO [Candidatus Woesearchaeota archaeon]|nr:serine protein kinase RIO [Candidatus Woesearchaeota archaeon]
MWQEQFKTLKDVFDFYTERNLFKLISEGHFDGLESPIGVGKEANTFSALKNGKRLLVKIYRLSTCDFNRMYDRIRADPRFENLKNQKRKVIFAWAKRESINLTKLNFYKMKVPKMIAQHDNILVMQFIGKNDPAPKLTHAPPKNPKKFFEEIISQIKIMYCKARFVHGDLSAFNILNWNEKPYFIDVSQATPLTNPNAQQMIERDIKNVSTYFRKLGLNPNERQIMSDLQQCLKTEQKQ